MELERRPVQRVMGDPPSLLPGAGSDWPLHLPGGSLCSVQKRENQMDSAEAWSEPVLGSRPASVLWFGHGCCSP